MIQRILIIDDKQGNWAEQVRIHAENSSFSSLVPGKTGTGEEGEAVGSLTHELYAQRAGRLIDLERLLNGPEIDCY